MYIKKGMKGQGHHRGRGIKPEYLIAVWEWGGKWRNICAARSSVISLNR